MRTLYMLLFCLSLGLCAQNKDIWSGVYIIKPVGTSDNKMSNVDTLVIEKTLDVNPKEIMEKYKSDLSRWTIYSLQDKNRDKKVVRRFLFDKENDEDEYKEFGWSDLHKDGKMECLDGGHFFICKTGKNSLVKFGNEESFLTKTGIFGVWLHY